MSAFLLCLCCPVQVGAFVTGRSPFQRNLLNVYKQDSETRKWRDVRPDWSVVSYKTRRDSWACPLLCVWDWPTLQEIQSERLGLISCNRQSCCRSIFSNSGQREVVKTSFLIPIIGLYFSFTDYMAYNDGQIIKWEWRGMLWCVVSVLCINLVFLVDSLSIILSSVPRFSTLFLIISFQNQFHIVTR
jgi:hypothetical protein